MSKGRPINDPDAYLTAYRFWAGNLPRVPAMKSAAAIARRLQAEGFDVSEVTVRRWVGKFKTLPQEFRDLDAPFDFFYPEAADLPCEALPVFVAVMRERFDLVKERDKLEKGETRGPLGSLADYLAARFAPPTQLTVRQARRIWWLHNAVHDEEPRLSLRVLYYAAIYLASAEMARDVLGHSDEKVRNLVALIVVDGLLAGTRVNQDSHKALMDMLLDEEARRDSPLLHDMVRSALENEAKVKKAKGATKTEGGES